MAIHKNSDGSYTVQPRKPGVEAAAFGAGFAPDLNGDGGFAGIEGGVEVTSGGLITYAIYTAVMTTLDTVPAVREGRITRAEQREIILDRTWSVTKGAVPTVIILGAVLALCPWLSLPMTLAGVVGGGVMITRLVRAGLDALPSEQREEIKAKAKEVGVEIAGVTDQSDEAATEPLPQLS